MSINANVDFLIWESNFFGRRIGRIRFSSTSCPLTPKEFTGFVLVQAKVAAQETSKIDALSILGFHLVEGEIGCCYNFQADFNYIPIAVLPFSRIRIAESSDIAAVRVLAAKTISLSRFRPPWFSNEERQRFYSQWVENAVHSNFDHLCLVADGFAGLEGLVTLRDIGKKTARIGLLAVSPDARSRGIGKLLCHAALDWCRRHRFNQLIVATQTANLPALRLYLKSGAQITHSAYWFYRGSRDSI